MTKLHYLHLRNVKRLPFRNLPKTTQRLFHRAPDRSGAFEFCGDIGGEMWAPSQQKVGFDPNLIYRVRSAYAPAGMADFEKESTSGKEP